MFRDGVIAIKPGCRGDATASNLLWRYEKFTPFCASPLFYRDRIFVVKDGGILTCIEAATGKANVLCHLLKQTQMPEVVRHDGNFSQP